MATSRSRKRVVVLGGAGAMGRAAVFELSRSGWRVAVLDADAGAARRIARRYGRGRAAAAGLDLKDAKALSRALARASVVVNCAPYRFNLDVMAAALDADCHYVDLGGLFHTTRKQLRLDARFRRAGLLAVLGMGSAPGITNVLARAACEPLLRVSAIRVYNGGTDHTRYASPLAFGFSPATVLDEFTMRPIVFEKRRFREKPPRSGAEDFEFPIGLQRTHLSLHSEVATLPLSFAAKGVRESFFKIAYDPVLAGRLQLLIDLGFADPRPGPRGVAPRDLLLDAFKRLPPPPEFVDDRDCLSVVAVGRDGRGPLRVRYDVTVRPQRRPPLSAVARDTGFAPAIVARMILDGRILERGVLPPERCVPVVPFLRELAKRGMRARRSLRRP